jgi:hypothetical protein
VVAVVDVFREAPVGVDDPDLRFDAACFLEAAVEDPLPEEVAAVLDVAVVAVAEVAPVFGAPLEIA